MSKVLFVERRLRTDKLGILYLSQILKNAGHSVDMVQDEYDAVEEYLKRESVDYVMYSVTSGEHRWYIQKNKALKKNYAFTAVVGGPHFTFFPEDGLDDPDIDVVVQGPGENVICNIVGGDIHDKLIKGSIPDDINALPEPDRSILYKYPEFGKAKMKRFIASRDCHYSCKYCFNHLYHRLYHDEKHKFFQHTAPEKMVKEIKSVQDAWGLELTYFNDDDLAGDHEWLFQFCEVYKKKIGIPFCGSIRANSVSPDVLARMADAGCTFLNIALESANPTTQQFLRRGDITNQQIEDACRVCNRLGIKVRLQNMIGLPVENPLQDALETLRYNQMINPTDSWAAIYQPFPKTDLWRYCVEKGLIRQDTECMNFYDDTPLSIPDAEKINRLHKWWFFLIKHQVPMEVVDVVLELELTRAQKQRLQDSRWRIAANLLYGM